MRKKMSEVGDDEMHADLLEVRRLLEAEIKLLLENYPAELIQYVTITAAIKQGMDLGQSPGDFCKTVARIVGLYCGYKPGGSSSVSVIEFPGGE